MNQVESLPVSTSTVSMNPQQSRVPLRKQNEKASSHIILKVYQRSDYEKQFKNAAKQFKQLEKNNNNDSIELTIRSQFESSEDLIEFAERFQRLEGNIRYLNWMILGEFGDDSYTNLIGECIQRMPNLFRLNLRFDIDTFFINGATSLAKTLPNLQELCVLSMILDTSEHGKQIINEAINKIPGLQFVDYDGFSPLDSIVSKKLASYSRNLASNESKAINIKKFSEELIPLKESLVHLRLRYNFEQIEGMLDADGNLVNDQDEESLLNSSLEICFELPLLTSLKHEFIIFAGSRLEKTEQLLRAFLREKRKPIQQLTAFQKYISPYLSINPHLVAIDLYF